MTDQVFLIDGRPVGDGQKPYVICELSGNHNGSLERALKLVDAAADTGCDAIKIQTYTPDTITMDCDRDEFVIKGGLWDGRTLYDLYGEAYTPFEWHAEIFARARSRGVTIFSTPFDETAVDLLEDLGAPAYKIASFEANDLPLIRYVARRGKPMIISTGMATVAEMERARDTALEAGAAGVILLHCVSSYPAPISDANIRTIPDMRQRLGVPIGLSDHTPGTAAAVAAVALGAVAIEKHFTLARADGGPDAEFSLEPAEFSALVRDCHNAYEALGSASYDLLGSERGSIIFRRSLYVTKPVKAGEVIGREHVRSIRPGLGLSPEHLDAVIGKRAAKDMNYGEPVDWSMIETA